MVPTFALVLHALDDVELEVERLRVLLHGDGALVAHGLHGLSDLLADLGIARGDGAHVGDLVLAGNRRGVGLDGLDHGVGGLLNAATDAERVGAGGHVAQTLGHDDIGQERGGGGAVAGHVVGLHGHLAHELSTHVLDRILQLNFLGDGHAVVGDGGGAVGLLQGDVAALGAKRHLDSVGQLAHAGSERAAGVGFKLDFFRHDANILSTVCK